MSRPRPRPRLLPLLALLLLAPLSRTTPVSLAPLSRQTVVTRCDDWVSVYAAYWARFPQCHRGLASTQCCELYDLMDKSLRIFQDSPALSCVVTNLNVFADKYAAHCTGATDVENDGSVEGGPGQPLPDDQQPAPDTGGSQQEGGHGDADGIIILPDGTTQIDNTSGSTGAPPPDSADTPTTAQPSSGTTGETVHGSHGHGCGSSSGCGGGGSGNCHQCCFSCCGNKSARALLLAGFSLQRTHGGECLNCSTCECNFDCTYYCTACSAPAPKPTPRPRPVCHQCCVTCCRNRNRSARALLLAAPARSALVRSGSSGGCYCNFDCNVNCHGCSSSGGPCTSDCSGTSGSNNPNPNAGDSGDSGDSGDNSGGNDDDDDDDRKLDLGGSTCFAADSVVQLQGGATKRMDQVVVGDVVRVGNGIYSEVFMFTHRSKTHAGEFVVLRTRAGKLAATKGHFVHSSRGVQAVETLDIGDAVRLGDGELVRIDGISREIRRGLYNPQTLHGDVVVDGFLATTYTEAVLPTAAQSLLAPVRALYRACGRRCGEQLDRLLFRAAAGTGSS